MTIYGKYGTCVDRAGAALAKGSHTTVFKGRVAASTTTKVPIKEATAVAVKDFPLPTGSLSDDAREVQLQILQRLVEELQENVIDAVPAHKNVCRLYGIEVIDGKAGGGLDRIELTMDWIEKMEGPKVPVAMPEAEVRRIAQDLVAGVAHLHDNGVSHDDIRPKNVLLTRIFDEAEKQGDDGRTFRAVVTDFALIRKIQALLDPESGNATTKQKPNYCAPEVFTAGGEYDAFKVDVWAIGATVLELLTAKLPFHELDPTGRGNVMFKIIQQRTPPKYPEGLSENAVNFLNACFDRNFDSRPSVEDLLNHPFIASE
jgi:serine/threonine protein kinase